MATPTNAPADNAWYLALREESTILHRKVNASRAKLGADTARLQSDHVNAMRGTIEKICKNDEDMYTYRVRAMHHLRDAVAHVRVKNVGETREANAINRLTRAYEMHVNPDDELSHIRREAVNQNGLSPP